jgi:hypothetical protein
MIMILKLQVEDLMETFKPSLFINCTYSLVNGHF